MLTTSTTKSFIVLVSNREDSKPKQRTAAIQRIQSVGLGPSVNVLGSYIFSGQVEFSSIFILEAESQSLIENVAEPYQHIFNFKIEEISSLETNPDVVSFDHCLLVANPKIIVKESPDESLLDIRSILQTSPDSDYPLIYFLRTKALHAINDLNEMITGNRRSFFVQIIPLESFFDEIALSPPTDPFGILALKDETPKIATIKNVGPDVLISTFGPLDYDAPSKDPILRSGQLLWNLHNQKLLKKGESMKVAENVYFADPKPANIQIDMTAPAGPTRIDSRRANWHPPTIAKTLTPNQVLEFNLSTGKFTTITDSYEALDTVVNGTSCDEPWLEDSYEKNDPEKYAIYQYITEKLGGDVRFGRLQESTEIETRAPYPKDHNPPFNEETYQVVTNELQLIVEDIAYVEKWFGDAGQTRITNLETSQIASEALSHCQELMSLEDKDNTLFILDIIFDYLEELISKIPNVGKTFSTLISLGYNTAKNIKEIVTPEHSINATVAELNDRILDNLKALEESRKYFYRTIMANRGKLKKFSLICRQGLLEADIKMDIKTTSYESYRNERKSLVDTLRNSWKIICYKSLFHAKHAVTSTIDTQNAALTTNLEYTYKINNFDPSKGNYGFNYILTGMASDSNGKLHTCYVTVDCTTDADEKVLAELFDKDQLDIDPLPFFFGFDGWPKSIPFNGLSWLYSINI